MLRFSRDATSFELLPSASNCVISRSRAVRVGSLGASFRETVCPFSRKPANTRSLTRGVKNIACSGELRRRTPDHGRHRTSRRIRAHRRPSFANDLIRVRNRQHDDFEMRIVLQQLAGRVETVQIGHADIDDDDIGIQLQGLFDRFAAVAGLAADFPSFMLFQSARNPRRTISWSSANKILSFIFDPLRARWTAVLNCRTLSSTPARLSSIERREYAMLAHCFHCRQQIARSIGFHNVSPGTRLQSLAHHLRRIVLCDE